MATFQTGSLSGSTDISSELATFQGYITGMRDVEDLTGGLYEVRSKNSARSNGVSISQDLSDYDRFRFRLDTSGSDLQLTLYSNAGTSPSLVKTISGNLPTAHNWYFISDGDSVTAPSYIYIISENEAGDSIDEILGGGLAIRLLDDYQSSLEVAGVNTSDQQIVLNERVPTAWKDELDKKGTLELLIMGYGSGETAERVTIDDIADTNPGKLHYTSLSGTYTAGSLIGKQVTNIYALDIASPELMFDEQGGAATAVAYKLMLPVGASVPCGGGSLSARNPISAGIEGTGILLDYGTWVSFGLPDTYALAEFAGVHLLDAYALSPDGEQAQPVKIFEGFGAFTIAIATGVWEVI